MNFPEKLIPLYFLSGSFFFGLIWISNPFLVARFIVLPLWLVSKFIYNPQIEEVLDLIGDRDAYMENFSGQLQTIHRAGYFIVFATLTGVGMVLLCGWM